MLAPFSLRRSMLATALISVLIADHSAGQGITGTLLGVVTDPSNAGVGKASVRITNVDTNQSNEIQTDSNGNYELPLLKPGNYRVAVSAPGFRTLVRDGIRLIVGDRLRVDLSLQVGALTETVNVSERAELVESGTASLGAALAESSVTNLPIRGRYVLQFAALAPGVQINPQAVNSGGGGLTGADFSVNGDVTGLTSCSWTACLPCNPRTTISAYCHCLKAWSR